MNNNATAVQLMLAGAMTAVGAMWGKLGWMFLLWAACAGLDVLTGCLAALRGGTWDSEIMHAGVWHKAAMVTVVLVGMLFDLTLHEIVGVAGVRLPIEGVLATPLLLSWYIVAGLGSILENADKLGAQHVPRWLTRGLSLVSDTIDGVGADKLGKGDGNE